MHIYDLYRNTRLSEGGKGGKKSAIIALRRARTVCASMRVKRCNDHRTTKRRVATSPYIFSLNISSSHLNSPMRLGCAFEHSTGTT